MSGKFGPYTLKEKRASLPLGELWIGNEGDDSVLLFLFDSRVELDEATLADVQELSLSVDSEYACSWSAFGIEGGQGWLCGPLLGETSFGEASSQDGGLTTTTAAQVVHQLTCSLSVGHIHGSLSDEFVRVDLGSSPPRAYVYGWGLNQVAAPYASSRKNMPFLGAPSYMAPEQCKGKPAGEESDVYAAGTLLYQSVRGKAPFAPTMKSATASTTLKRQIFEKPLALNLRFAKVPYIDDFQKVVFKALEKKSDHRYADADLLRDALNTLLSDVMSADVPTDSGRKADVTEARATEPVEEPEENTPGSPASARKATMTLSGMPPMADPAVAEVAAKLGAAKPKKARKATKQGPNGPKPRTKRKRKNTQPFGAMRAADALPTATPQRSPHGPNGPEPASSQTEEQESEESPAPKIAGVAVSVSQAGKGPTTDEGVGASGAVEATDAESPVSANEIPDEPEDSDAWFAASANLTGASFDEAPGDDDDDDDDVPFGAPRRFTPGMLIGLGAAVIAAILIVVVISDSDAPTQPTAKVVKDSAKLQRVKEWKVTPRKIAPGKEAPKKANPQPKADATAAAPDAALPEADTASPPPAAPEKQPADKTEATAPETPPKEKTPVTTEAKPDVKKPTPGKREVAQESYALGSQAETRGDLKAALRHYDNAYKKDRSYAAARDAMARIRARLAAAKKAEAPATSTAAAKKDPPKKPKPKKDPPPKVVEKKDPPKKDPPKKDPPKKDPTVAKKDPPASPAQNKAESARLLKLGMGAYKNGRYGLAAKYFAKAKSLDSSNLLARKYLQQARRQMQPK